MNFAIKRLLSVFLAAVLCVSAPGLYAFADGPAEAAAQEVAAIAPIEDDAADSLDTLEDPADPGAADPASPSDDPSAPSDPVEPSQPDQPAEPLPTTVTGLIMEKALKPSHTMADAITISPAYGRVVYLQRKSAQGKWVTINSYVTPVQEQATVKLQYPASKWKNSASTTWRVYAPATDQAQAYQSKNILLYTKNREKVALTCKAAVVMNATTGRVYYDKYMTKRLTQASITKVMTALLALENASLTDKFTISSKAKKTPWTYFDYEVGDQVYMKHLLFAALLPSSNGSAVALAEGTAGSTKKFAQLMNQKAAELGMTGTKYVTPHGLTTEGHYTTAYDQALLMSYASKNKTFMKVVGKKSYSFKTAGNGLRCQMVTTNKLLGKVSGVLGGKTGTTDLAGNCFAGIYRYKGQTYVTVVLGSKTTDNRWSDTKKLIRYIKRYGW